MAIFAVLTDKPNPELGKKIEALYPRDFYKITDSQWLISADSIPRSLAGQLDLRTGSFGRALVIGVTGTASGWHSKTVWEWIAQKVSSDDA